MNEVQPLHELKARIQDVIVGQEETIDRLIIALLSGGHVLLEGPPGLAKTTLIQTLATLLDASFQRIQFTPDLMPADLTGSEIFESSNERFRFIAGPVFHEILLADEINRAPPKVQSALLEAMAEHQVTVAGKTYELPKTFMVLATQNPLEQSGTYPLPEAQLDRFLFKIVLNYPSVDEEIEITRRALAYSDGLNKPNPSAVMTPQQIQTLGAQLANQYIDPRLERFAVELVNATRHLDQILPKWGGYVSAGASPRGSIALLRAASARALLDGRDHIVPEDIHALAVDVLRHRIVLSYAANVDGITDEIIIKQLLETLPSV